MILSLKTAATNAGENATQSQYTKRNAIALHHRPSRQRVPLPSGGPALVLHSLPLFFEFNSPYRLEQEENQKCTRKKRIG